MNQKQIYETLENDFAQSEDQWNFETSSHEKERFKKLLSFARSVPHASILEIGCAEGHFTELLATISQDITAIDVTPLAIQRAKKRVKSKFVTFEVTTIDDFTPTKKYDLIICAEMLYYILDKKKALNKIQTLGKYLLANNYLFFPIYKDGIKAELSLLRFRPVRWILHATPKEKKYCSIGMWKLN